LHHDFSDRQPKEGSNLQTVILRGKVFSGHGGGTKFIKLPWVRRQIIEKLGFEPYCGTLNLKLTEGSIAIKQQLLKLRAIGIVPVKGFCCGLCFKARIMDKVEGAIIIPQVPSYPENVLEVISPICLRERLGLRDGDEVRLTVYPPA
jgi:riboflavin kinase